MEPTAASSLLTDDDAHEMLPAASDFTAGTIARDRSCRVTHDVDAIEAAHICPMEEKTWFFENEMSVYNLNDILSPHIAMNDMSNAVTLRAGIHKIFDDKKFVFVPKAGRWVIHFLRHTHNMGSIFHNVPVELTPLVSISFLLTRFAWAILSLVAVFVNASDPRNILGVLFLTSACTASILVLVSASANKPQLGSRYDMTALPTCTCNRKSGGTIVKVFEDNRNRRKRRGKGDGVEVGTGKRRRR